MKGFNLSDWALRHQSFVWYLMFVALLMGVFSYMKLGREEDPSFAIKTMVIQTRWPGATTEETLRQVTERVEKKLEELDSLDYTKSFTRPGSPRCSSICATPRRPRRFPTSGTRCARRSRTSRANSPRASTGPAFNDEFGDVFGSIYAFTGDGFSMRQLRDQVEQVRREIRSVPGIGKVQLIGAENEVIYLDFSTRKLAALGIDQRQVMQSLQQQNAVTPSGTIESGAERISVRTSGEFRSTADLAPSICASTTASIGSPTWPTSAAATPIRPVRCFATTASRPSAWPSP